jgi:beta-galactosidase
MNKKMVLLSVFALGFWFKTTTGSAQTVLKPGIDYPLELEDPELLGINKEPYHATMMPYANLQEALVAKRLSSSLCRSLNGNWKFNWVPSPEQRPANFYKPTFDVSKWADIPVPSNWEVHGYGTPFYRNLGYTIKKDYPRTMSEPDIKYTAFKERNPVGSYRRDFDVPVDWVGRRIFITFEGVDCAFFLWINGEKVGYSVNSRNAADFDLTKYVKPGINAIAVEVYQYSSGTWLEDQDMWRLHGIYRNVTLWCAPQVHIRDFFVKPELDKEYKNATLEIKAKIKNYGDKDGKAQTLTATLYDKEGNEVAKGSASCYALNPKQEEPVNIKFPVSNPAKWTAETPNLYTVVLSSSEGEIVSSKIGFRKIEIKGRIFMVNGVPIKLKGVNRHEHWSDVGHAITEEQMIRDLEVIKQGNCNHVRTSHYSNSPRWYELCDEWGIWLVAEANAECHGYDGRFDNEPTIKKAIVDRNVANIENFKNHPSVIIWSLGNECGWGATPNFVAAMTAIKEIDPSRPVHYERFGTGNNNPADLDGRMYGTAEDYAKVAQNKELTKPFYICEFVHAMFNSMGSLTDYSEVFDNNPEILGGAIWEYQDQALWNKRNPARPILAYGGGFGEFPNDHYFIHKGVISYDRSTDGNIVKPHYPEMKKAFQWIGTNLAEPELGGIWITNKFQFISLDNFEGLWSLTENGTEIDKGTFHIPHIRPRGGWWANIPYKIEHPKPGAEYFLRVSYIQKNKTLWADKGFEVASEQFKLPIKTIPGEEPQISQLAKLTQDAQEIKISGTGFSVAFDKKSGFMNKLEKSGINVFTAEGSPKLYLYRAPHQTDDWWVDRVWNKYGINSLSYSLVDIKAEVIDNTTIKVTSIIKTEGKEGFGAYHTTSYVIKGNGLIKVENKVQFTGMRINLARIGVRILLNKNLAHVQYFGRGPVENYADRKSAQDIGVYDLDVNNQYEYEKPMERGNHEDVRWLKFSGKEMPSLIVKADENLMQFSALPHTDEQMSPVEYKIDLPANTATVFCLSTKTMGVGSASCGPRPLEKYLVWSDNTQFGYTLQLLQD